MSDPLALPLHDIHLPAQVSFWPPAPGYWIFTAAIVFAVLVTVYLYQKRKRNLLLALKLARDELSRFEDDFISQSNHVDLARNISALLRRLCISLYPRTETASLTGKEWFEFLDRRFNGANLTNDQRRILVETPYRQQVSRSDVEFLLSYCRDWIDMVSKRGRSKND